jgi:hypothetical protein
LHQDSDAWHLRRSLRTGDERRNENSQDDR